MSRPKLLLADDSVAVRKVVELTFTDEGIDVIAVPDAETAMYKFIEVQPDIVLVDVGLSGTSGYQICEMIKHDEATANTPVLLLVGSFEPFDQDAAENARADGFLTKPFQSIRELVDRVWELLGREPAAEEVVEPPVEEPGPDSDIDTAVTVPAIDTADIDHLYNDSFATTAEIDEFQTIDDLFDDSGLDDELIDAEHPNPQGVAEFADELSPEEAASTIKEFDWSPAAKVDTTEPAEEDTALQVSSEGDDSEGEPSGEVELDHDDHDVLAGVDQDAAPDVNAGPESDAPVHNDADDESAARPERANEVELLTATPISGEATSGIAANAVEPPAVSEEPEKASDQQNDYVFPAVPEVAKELSPELIDKIVDRVLERLNDRVVREVAQEAVPRIAEKVIREALSGGSKSS